jgi:hypothetical protein
VSHRTFPPVTPYCRIAADRHGLPGMRALPATGLVDRGLRAVLVRRGAAGGDFSPLDGEKSGAPHGRGRWADGSGGWRHELHRGIHPHHAATGSRGLRDLGPDHRLYRRYPAHDWGTRKEAKYYTLSGGVSNLALDLTPITASDPGAMLCLATDQPLDLRLNASNASMLSAVRGLRLGALISALFVTVPGSAAATIRLDVLGGGTVTASTPTP